MRMRKLGSSGIEASVVSLGTWAIGGWAWAGTDEKKSIRAVHASLDEGINFIDTAPVYGFGVSESLVGKAIEGKRSKFVLATKCGLVADSRGRNYFFSATGIGADPTGLIKIHKVLSPLSIREEVEMSLKRLGTDYIDLYQTHWQDETTPIQETMETLLSLKREGKIRAIGVSNATISQIKEYQKWGAVDGDQEKYSMLDRDCEEATLPFLKNHNIAFLAYSPLAMGLLTGKVDTNRTFASSDLRAGNKRFSHENRTQVSKMLSEMDVVAKKYGASTASFVLAWTLQQPGITHVLCGARNDEQVLENAKAGRLEIAPEDLECVTKILSQYPPIA